MADNDLRNRIRSCLVETLSHIQREAKREVPQITEDTIPFDHLPGFDSVSGVEAAILFSERVGVEIDEISFVSAKTGRRMPLRDVVDSIVQKNGAAIAAKTPSHTTAAATA